MIVRPKPDLLALMFAVRGSIIGKAAPRVAVMTVFALAVVLAADGRPTAFKTFGPAPFTLFGIALSVFLGFRNNACDDRWWEGRKIWGQIIIEIRSLRRQSQDIEPQARRRLLRDACGFAHALAAELREKEAAGSGLDRGGP